MAVATPCIGLCSTTFGDVVCRGCKRYVHEIVGWNGFTDGQQRIVIARLQRLRGESLCAYAAVRDAPLLAAVAASMRIDSTLALEVRAFPSVTRRAR